MSAAIPPLPPPSLDPRGMQDFADGEGPKTLRQNNFRVLYASSVLVDFGLCLYFFMFSLFLVEHRFTERAIGFITASLTIGTIAGTLPASLLSRRFGLRAMMLAYTFAAPVCLAARVLFLGMQAQIGFAFLAGAAMSVWSVCFSPTLAKLTTRENRASGFSLFVATGIASGALAGLIGGYLPGLIERGEKSMAHVDGIRVVLLMACAMASVATFATLRLRLEEGVSRAGSRLFSSFLVRFLVAVAVWNFAISFFTPFANVYLSRHLGLPLPRIGVISFVSQSLTVLAVLLAPLLYRRAGIVLGIALTQLGTGVMLWGLSSASGIKSATGMYVLLTALQWMGGAGISSLLMNRTPEDYRSHAAAMHNLVNLAAQAGAAALAGKAFEQYGYTRPLIANAAIAFLAAVLFYGFLRGSNQAAAGPAEGVPLGS